MIHTEDYKEPQHNLRSEKFLSAKKLYLPLSQHTGKPSLLGVEVGKTVEEGETLGLDDGFISARLHSPKKGKVIQIGQCKHHVLNRAPCVALECTQESRVFQPRVGVDNLSMADLLEIIKHGGVVGMGGAAFPTHVKLSPPKKIDTLIINGCECEPYLASDYRLMLENLEGILRGIEIISKIIEPKKVFFALEDNKPEAIKKLNLVINLKKSKVPHLSLAVLKTAYPQGSEKQLIHALTKRRVPSGGLPFDVGCLVQNVATCFAVYEAVYFNKPLIERLVTFAGDALVSSKNIWVKIGTLLSELFESGVLRFKTEPSKIICGGPMMGIAIDSLDYPILKGTGGFLFLARTSVYREEHPCIRCGACVRECPVNLMPTMINLYALRERWMETKSYGASDCIECGVCSYVCPTNRRLVQSIKRAKLQI